jgi:hypothetical protein
MHAELNRPTERPAHLPLIVPALVPPTDASQGPRSDSELQALCDRLESEQPRSSFDPLSVVVWLSAGVGASLLAFAVATIRFAL